MCASASTLYATCLDEWDLDWQAAGYDDAAGFVDACETWAWQMRELEADAVQRDQLDEPSAVDAACADRNAVFTDDLAVCEDYADVDWSTVPWK